MKISKKKNYNIITTNRVLRKVTNDRVTVLLCENYDQIPWIQIFELLPHPPFSPHLASRDILPFSGLTRNEFSNSEEAWGIFWNKGKIVQ